MDALDNLFDGLENVISTIPQKLFKTAAIVGSAVGGTILVTSIAKKRQARKTSKKTTKKKKTSKTRTKRGRSRDRKFRSKQKHELAYVRRKRKAGKKITRPRYKTKKRQGKTYYTKNGQPYKILASGKARFIKRR